MMIKIIRFYNTGYAFVSDERGEHDVPKFMGECILRKAENEYAHCQYRAYSNGDKEYIFY